MFTRHTGTGIESAILAYMPEGFSPFEPALDADGTILAPGHTVLVISVWDRDSYLPGAVLLAYVHCYETGESTHVPVTDLVDPKSIKRVVDYRQPLPAGRW